MPGEFVIIEANPHDVRFVLVRVPAGLNAAMGATPAVFDPERRCYALPAAAVPELVRHLGGRGIDALDYTRARYAGVPEARKCLHGAPWDHGLGEGIGCRRCIDFVPMPADLLTRPRDEP